jgi:hypothetical protein
MRSFLATVALVTLVGAPAAWAETRTFIIVNNADGYGVDRCLATGARCGAAAATAVCKAREFAIAVSYRKVDKGDITGGVPRGNRDCPDGICEQFVAIECTR